MIINNIKKEKIKISKSNDKGIFNNIKRKNKKNNTSNNKQENNKINKLEFKKSKNSKNFPPIRKQCKSIIIKSDSSFKILKNKNNVKHNLFNNLKPDKRISKRVMKTTMMKLGKKENSKNNINNILKLNITEINLLTYTEALNKDHRTYISYYISLLRTRHIFISSFFKIDDYNYPIIKKFLFFFFFIVNFTINALFFNDSIMHQIYDDEGSYIFIYQIPQILYSSIISGFINWIIKYLALSENNIIQFKRENNLEKINLISEKLWKYLKIKFASFFIIAFLFLLIFSYYDLSFCGIFVNTQIHLLKDSVISFGFSLLYPFGFFLIF